MSAQDDDGDDEEVGLAEILKEVRRIEMQSRRLVTDVMSGGYTSVFRGTGIEFDTVREYEEGDDPRSVDWNVTARVGRPFVKKYVDERELSIWFLVDLSASMRGGFGLWSARETAARFVACLALSAVRNDDKVALLAFGSRIERHLLPGKGFRHALRLVRDVLALRCPPGPTDLATPLDLVGRIQRRRSVVFVVSDFLAEGYDKALAHAAARHDVVAVRCLSPELTLPRAGLVSIADPETGARTIADFAHAETRSAYARRVAAWKLATDEAFRKVGVDVLDLAIPAAPDKDALVRPILAFFKMRELRGAKR